MPRDRRAKAQLSGEEGAAPSYARCRGQEPRREPLHCQTQDHLPSEAAHPGKVASWRLRTLHWHSAHRCAGLLVSQFIKKKKDLLGVGRIARPGDAAAQRGKHERASTLSASQAPRQWKTSNPRTLLQHQRATRRPSWACRQLAPWAARGWEHVTLGRAAGA